MLKIYCSKCGSPTSYTANKPKFCSNCGNSFENNSQKTLIKHAKEQKITKNLEDYDQDEDGEDLDYDQDANSVPDISKLECEITDSRVKGEKLGSILGTLSNLNDREIEGKNKKSLPKQDRKKFLEEFAKEAGALKPKLRSKKNGA